MQCWSLTWLLGFNASKCILLRIRDIIKYIYSINGEVIKQEHTQKDLGVLMSDDLKPAKHVEAIVKKANQRIGLFKRSFTGFSSKKVSLYYKHIIRPVLEYGAPAWNPWHTKDIQLLEKTQDRCLKLSQEEIKLESLEERRKRTDLIETYKYLNGHYKTNADTFFSYTQRPLRGHSQKLYHNRCQKDPRKYFFCNRVVAEWNKLPQEVISAPSVDSFKKKLRSLPKGTEG